MFIEYLQAQGYRQEARFVGEPFVKRLQESGTEVWIYQAGDNKYRLQSLTNGIIQNELLVDGIVDSYLTRVLAHLEQNRLTPDSVKWVDICQRSLSQREILKTVVTHYALQYLAANLTEEEPYLRESVLAESHPGLFDGCDLGEVLQELIQEQEQKLNK